MRVGRDRDIVVHDVNGVVEAVGKESGRCSSGGEVGLSAGSFYKESQSAGAGIEHTEAATVWNLEHQPGTCQHTRSIFSTYLQSRV